MSAVTDIMTDRAHRFFPSELLIRVYENVPRPQLHAGLWLIPHTSIWEQQESDLSKCRLNDLSCKCTVHRWKAESLTFPLMYGTYSTDEKNSDPFLYGPKVQ